MNTRIETTLAWICGLSALILAVSFALPLTEYTTYVGVDGKPLGLAGQLFSGPQSASVTSHGFFWEDLYWMTPVVFFVPGLMMLLRWWGAPRLAAAITLASPLIGAVLLVPLATVVSFADFGVFPGTGGERSYGGYVALLALGSFCLASGTLACSEVFGMIGSRRSRKRTQAGPGIA